MGERYNTSQKFIKDLSKLTDRMRHLLKKNIEWKWTEERESDFKKVKETLAELPYLTRYFTESAKTYYNNGCKQTRSRSHTLANTTRRNSKTNPKCKQISKRRRKEIFDERTRIISSRMGIGTLSAFTSTENR